MLTIRDLTDQFEIQGNVVVKEWIDGKERYNILCKSDSAIFNNKVIDKEIKYMYSENDKLVIEV